MAKYIEHGIYDVKLWDLSATSGTGTPVDLIGARNVSVDAEREDTQFYADNIVYAVISGNKTVTGTYTAYNVPDELFEKMGFAVDNNGALVDTGTVTPGILQWKTRMLNADTGEEFDKLTILYNVTFGQATGEDATDEDTAEPKELEIPLTCAVNENVKLNGKSATMLMLTGDTPQKQALIDGADTTLLVPTGATIDTED